MKEQVLINVKELMVHHNLDETFIDSIESYQLVTFVIKNNNRFVDVEEMSRIEQIIRLHYDLEINMEGIEVIRNMLDKMETLQNTIRQLQNKLRIYQ